MFSGELEITPTGKIILMLHYCSPFKCLSGMRKWTKYQPWNGISVGL
jgi:hypothetical protein